MNTRSTAAKLSCAPDLLTPGNCESRRVLQAQFNGTKYTMMMSGALSTFGDKQVARTLGYVGADIIEEAMLVSRHGIQRNRTEFVAGCLLHPGDALYMPPWTYHDVVTITPSVSMGTRFDVKKLDRLVPKYPVDWNSASVRERGRWGVAAAPRRQP